MKTTYTKRVLALLLSLVVMLSMCLAGTVSAFAASGGATKMAVQPAAGTAEAEADAVSYIGAPLSGASANAQIPEYTTVNAENLNTTSTGTVYNSPGAGSYKEFTYKINMPKAGTLILRYIGINTSGAVSGSVYDTVSGSGVMSLRTSTADDGTRIREYAVSQAGTYTVKFSLSSPSGTTSVYFVPLYVPYTVSAFKAPSSSFSKYRYVAGHGNTSTVSTFKITVPTKGKLKLDLEGEEGYSVYMKTSGFGDYEYVSSSNVRRTIGVKKGTYTFKVKSNAPVIAYRARFYKVSESKYGLKKSTAASMKKKVYKKGLIVANDKKSHYYKFYNPKLQKVSIVINTAINGGGNYGGIKVTLYDRKGTIGTKTIYPETATTTIKLYTLGKNNRLVKGTYKIKVQSYKSGNGYFSVKWK